MSWAYSPSYGKPLSVPQGVIGLASRFGMDIVLAHPKGYDLIPEVVEMTKKQAIASGGNFSYTDSMDEAFKDADIVYPKSWAPYDVMLRRVPCSTPVTRMALGSWKGSARQQRQVQRLGVHRGKMKLTRNGKALYMHCLPADITDVSCEAGEVAASVFDRYRDHTYREASYKPYIIAAMILLGKFGKPADLLESIVARATSRIFGG